MSDSRLMKQQLVTSCQGLVRSLAWKIHCKLPRSVDLEDLVSYGQIGLVEAAHDFDGSRGGQFTTYAYYRIRGAILDGLSKMAWFSRSDYYSSRYERHANDMLVCEGGERRSSDALDDDVRWFGRVSNGLAVVYLLSHANDDENGESAALEDHEADLPSAGVMKTEMARKLREMIAALPTDAATLIRAAYFEGISLKEAGERIGISKSWASRLHAQALGKLAQSLTLAEMVD